MKSDVIVMGAGLSGLCAGLQALEQGLQVTLLEKSELVPGWNSSRVASGIFHLGEMSPEDNPQEIIKHITEITDGYADQALVKALVDATMSAMLWIDGKLAFKREAPEHGWAADPHGYARSDGLPWEDYGMDKLMQALHAEFIRLGGTFHNGMNVQELMINHDGFLRGVQAEGIDGNQIEFEAQTVILADGGFHANLEMVQTYISPNAKNVKLRAIETASGDSIRMAGALGAAVVNMSDFYGHCLHKDAMENDRLWPYPTLDILMTAGIVVDTAGQRIMNEDGGGVMMTNVLARRADPGDCWVIFDESIWQSAGRFNPAPANPLLEEMGAEIYKAQDWESLAELVGIPAQTLAFTVIQYNRAHQDDHLSRLPIPRTITKYAANPLETAPFYALPIAPGITHTMGGLKVSPRMEVLDELDQPIIGLFAAGGVVGGLDGGPRVGYVGGLVEAAVFGYIAGLEVSKQTEEVIRS